MAKKGKEKKKGKASIVEEDSKKDKKAKGKKGKKGKESPSPVASISAEVPQIEEPPEPVREIPPAKLECLYPDAACNKSSLACRPNRYPGLLGSPVPMAVVGSECGTYESLCKLLRAGFQCADRILIMTPWGNYVVIRTCDEYNVAYFVFDGCTCNVNRFRYLDLSCGTAGLIYFDGLHELINYIIESQEMRSEMKRIRKSVIDDICKEFCEYTAK